MWRARFAVSVVLAGISLGSCGDSTSGDRQTPGGSAGTTAGSGGEAGSGKGGTGSGTAGNGEAGAPSAGTGGKGLGGTDGGAGEGGVDGGEGGAVSGGEGGAAGAGGAPDECGDTGGLTAEELLANVDTFVVLVMEGRSFDHYLGSLSLEGKPVNGLTGSESNPDPDQNDVLVHELNATTLDIAPPTDWDAAHLQWNQGMNDGFVTTAAGANQETVMGYYTRALLPISYGLADGGVVCDAWFSSVLGPTWPNRFYLHGATSNGLKTSFPINSGFTSIFDRLSEAGVDAVNYHGDVAWASGAYFKLSGLASMDQFLEDAAAGNLPAFSLVDPTFLSGGANDDGPSHDIRLGQALISTVFAALAQSPQWSRSLFLLTYAQPGGYFDHVSPPTTVDERAEFAQLGFRVPTILAGPFVKRGCVLSETLEHVSIIKTLTTRFGLASLNARVDATRDLSGVIHAPYLSDPQPPPILPPPVLPLERRMLESKPALRRILDRGVRLGAVRWP